MNFNWWHLSTGGETVCPLALAGRLKRVLEEEVSEDDMSDHSLEQEDHLSVGPDGMELDRRVGGGKRRSISPGGATAGLSSGSLMLWQQLF